LGLLESNQLTRRFGIPHESGGNVKTRNERMVFHAYVLTRNLGREGGCTTIAQVTVTQGEPCLQPTAPPSLGPSGPLLPLRVSIGDTTYGETWRGGREEYTQVA
jgi:hypothetical protein